MGTEGKRDSGAHSTSMQKIYTSACCAIKQDKQMPVYKGYESVDGSTWLSGFMRDTVQAA